MRLILQRVSSGGVSVDDEVVGKIGAGYVILIGITHSDTAETAKKMAKKVVHLRVFSDEAGKMNRSALDVGAEMLVVSQFTLYANSRRGRRPGYTDAASPAMAEMLVERFIQSLQQLGVKKVASGVFGADMLVDIKNDGPVTIILEET
ncbi:MAG: D-tyrosyl-tRNA(Tyr) deacylase [Anaerolineaceae bacterium 4572_5.2]|nr:MAG: D-tyrosyl-tRNA(Tyr) deacylase [Anaerolineaceae bacterium 4572_5.2]